MNPDTGQFHELMSKEAALQVAEREEARSNAYDKHRNKSKYPLHPKDADLVVKAAQKRVPVHWPIFTKGESYEIVIGDSTGSYRLDEVLVKDIVLKPMTEFPADPVGQVFELKGYKFRVRKVIGRTYQYPPSDERHLVVRPVIGRPQNYVK